MKVGEVGRNYFREGVMSIAVNLVTERQSKTDSLSLQPCKRTPLPGKNYVIYERQGWLA